MIEYAVREHFPDLPPSMGPVPYARNYLEKLIQVPFRIPSLGLAETRIYITLLQAEAVLGAEHIQFKKMLDSAREELKRPWLSRGLDISTVGQAFDGQIPTAVAMAVKISVQISAILTDGTRGNPRQIKRFLNSMNLRRAIADERGFGDEIDNAVLAKIMLAESFAADLYKQLSRLAVTAPDGKAAAIIQLEAAVKPPGTNETGESSGRRRSSPAALRTEPDVEEWLKSEWVKGWATIDPSLGGVDLRPYVFATRDKRSYLGGLAASGHLEGIVERLMGPRLAVSGMATEVSKLSGLEPEQVFDAVTSAIQMTEDLMREPKGIHGLILLVGQHAGLQRRLCKFLAELPAAKLGAWAPSNFGSVFTDPGVASEFTTLLNSWATQTDSSKLKNAAIGVLKVAGGA
jgi:hypothetical protein